MPALCLLLVAAAAAVAFAGDPDPAAPANAREPASSTQAEPAAPRPARRRGAMFPYSQRGYVPRRNEPLVTPASAPGVSFLDRMLDTHGERFDVTCSWERLPGLRYGYRIEIQTDAPWREAHLCVDGRSVARFTPDNHPFEWDFQSLPWGRRQLAVLVADQENRIGLAKRTIRIR